jgi:putative ubiquitin-RnfH superfamily antitoxin RatB of RatAB toxin-antitoxin module
MIPLPDYKTIVDLIKKGATLEAQELIIQLREAAVGLREENLALKEKLKELESALEVSGELEWDGKAYWRRTAEPAAKEGPFCQACYDQHRKLIRIVRTKVRSSRGIMDGYVCNVCKAEVTLH